MKITKEYLKQLIKESIEETLEEASVADEEQRIKDQIQKIKDMREKRTSAKDATEDTMAIRSLEKKLEKLKGSVKIRKKEDK